jgi:predicted kinase
MLIILGGLPASGKTTIARALATHFGAVHIRIDTIEQRLRDLPGMKDHVGEAGYRVAYGVAEDNLRVGGHVVADSVNPLAITRAAWRAVADRAKVPFIEIEIVCRDANEHRHRAESRISDIAGLVAPRWQSIVARDYEPWVEEHRIIDTAGRTVGDVIDEAIAIVAGAPGGGDAGAGVTRR